MPKKTFVESFLVVEGAGEFPIDMLRYDCAFPVRELEDAYSIQRDRPNAPRRRIVLCRRGAAAGSSNPARWKSFGWVVVGSYADVHDAYSAAKDPLTEGPLPPSRG